MIISRTPLRVSLAGGGTDLPGYYKTGYGSVVSTTIRDYIYVTVNKRFEDTIRVGYSKTEIVDGIDDIEHGIVRECLRRVGIVKGIEITTIADIPSKGTGLGSSSALAVGLLNALYAFKGFRASPKRLAEEACQIEIDELGEPIGKQDQYIAAYGGIQHLRFLPDESVLVEPVICPRATKDELENHMMLFYTGKVRRARDILARQKADMSGSLSIRDRMRDQSDQLFKDLTSLQVDSIGTMFKEGWELKKSLAEGITDAEIDGIYDRAIRAGAVGGKITGAGGGGFLVLYARPEDQWAVRNALTDLKEIEFRLEPQGSRIIYVGDDM